MSGLAQRSRLTLMAKNFTVTAAQKQAVIERLLKGCSWHRAAKESIPQAIGPKLRGIVFALRADKDIQQALVDAADEIQSKNNQDKERCLREIEEGLELARDASNYNSIGALVMKKAELLGLTKSQEPDDFSRQWERMSVTERMTYLGEGMARLTALQARLQERGLVIEHSTTGEKQQPGLSNGGLDNLGGKA